MGLGSAKSSLHTRAPASHDDQGTSGIVPYSEVEEMHAHWWAKDLWRSGVVRQHLIAEKYVKSILDSPAPSSHNY